MLIVRHLLVGLLFGVCLMLAAELCLAAPINPAFDDSDDAPDGVQRLTSDFWNHYVGVRVGHTAFDNATLSTQNPANNLYEVSAIDTLLTVRLPLSSDAPLNLILGAGPNLQMAYSYDASGANLDTSFGVSKVLGLQYSMHSEWLLSLEYSQLDGFQTDSTLMLGIKRHF